METDFCFSLAGLHSVARRVTDLDPTDCPARWLKRNILSGLIARSQDVLKGLYFEETFALTWRYRRVFKEILASYPGGSASRIDGSEVV